MKQRIWTFGKTVNVGEFRKKYPQALITNNGFDVADTEVLDTHHLIENVTLNDLRKEGKLLDEPYQELIMFPSNKDEWVNYYPNQKVRLYQNDDGTYRIVGTVEVRTFNGIKDYGGRGGEKTEIIQIDSITLEQIQNDKRFLEA